MGQIYDDAAEVYRAFATDGVPASGPNDPSKTDIIGLFKIVDAQVGGAISGVTSYATVAALPASTNSGKIYLVTSDPTAANNGYWQDQSGGNVILTALNNALKGQAGTNGTMSPSSNAQLTAGTDNMTSVTPAGLTYLGITPNTAPKIEALREGAAVIFSEPNRFLDGDFKFAGSTSLGVWNISAPVVSINSRGRKVGTFTGKGESYVNHPASWFGGPGAPISFGLSIENQSYTSGVSNKVYLHFLDANNAEIGTVTTVFSSMATSTADTYVKVENLTIPAGCVTVRTSIYTGGNAANSISFCWVLLSGSAKADYRPIYSPPASSRVVTVDGTNGADTGDGSPAAPFATIERAMTALRGGDNVVSGTIRMRGGDYVGQSVTLGPIQGIYLGGYVENLRLEAAPNERVRLILGTALASITKSSGYTKVYQATITAKQAPRNFLYEHETPEGLIPLAERHPNHLGLAYRCPSYRMVQVASIALCDATAATWYYDATNKIIYFHPPADGDPTSNGKTYYLPSTDPSTSLTYYKTAGVGGAAGMLAADQGKIGHFAARGIEVWYGYRGFDMTGVGSYWLEDCVAIGSWGQGFQFGTSSGFDINCRSIAAGEDGYGSTGDSAAHTVSYVNQRCVSINFYSTMNYDDGRSMHQRTNDTVYGGLSEYNNDSGAAYVIGSEAVLYGTTFRKNGQGYGIVYPADSSLTGEGLTVRQSADTNEAGVNSCVVAHDIISDGNRYNYSCGSAGNNMRLYSPTSMNASVAGYRCLSGAEMDVYDGRTMNETAKEISGGTLNVYTTSALT